MGVIALLSAVLMLVIREPMRVALALITTMVMLGGIYGLLGVHFIAAFQVLIYVGAVMVLFLFVVMMLDVNIERVRGGFIRHAGLGLVVASLVAAQMIGVFWARDLGVDIAVSVGPVGKTASN